jgi:hypothetical protein
VLTSELVEAVRQEGMFPSSDESTVATRIIDALNREQRLYLARLLLSVRESHQVAHADVALSASVTRYRIPSRAVGAKLKLVSLVRDTGVAPLFPMPYEREVVDGPSGGPGDYWLESNHVVLRRAPDAGNTLRLTYFRRLGELVPEGQAGVVESFDLNAQTVTLTSVPDGWVAGATRYDFIQSASHYDTLGADQSATLAGDVLTFAEELPEDLAVGDYVALARQSPVCQAPRELHDVLGLRTAFALLDAVGDPKAVATERRLQRAEGDALALLAPRVDASPKRLINRDGPGWSRFFGKRRWL